MLISFRRGLEDNQHETLAHVARGCYAACNGASPNGAIILNISIITAASSLFLPFSPFLMIQQEISEMYSSIPYTGKRTSEHDHTSLVLNHT